MPDKVKEFYGAIQNYGIFKDEAEFRSQVKSNPKEVFQVFDSIDETKGVFRDYSDFETNLDLKKKDNSAAPTASSGMGVSMAGKGSQRNVLGDYGISTKPKQKEPIKGVPASVANPKLQKEAGIKPKEQFSNFNDLNKQVVETVARVEGNRQKDIASMTGGAKGLLEKANDVIVETLTSGTASVLSGVAGLVGSVADLAINKTPQKKAPFLSNEWFQSKIPVIQQGEVSDPAWWSNQGIRDKMMSLSENLSKISTGELGVAKTEIGLEDSAKSSIDYIIEGDYKNGAKSALIDIGQQIPQLVAMAMSGGSNATLGVMGASSAGSNLSRQYQDGDISVLDFAQGVSVGIAEAVTEKVFNLDIKALSRVGGRVSDFLGDSGKALQRQIQEEGVDVVKSKLIRSFGGALKEAGMGFGQEVLEENIVSTVDYLTKALDENVLNKKGFEEFTKELGQNMIVAGPTGGGASLLAATASLKPLTKEEKVKISQYEQVLNNENSSKEVKEIAKQRIDAINNGSNTESEALYDQVMTLPIEERVQVIDKLNTIKKIEAEAEMLPLELREDADIMVARLREEVNFALNPKEAEVQGTNKGIEAATDTTNRIIEQSDKIQAIEARMNNAEYIDEKDINTAPSVLPTIPVTSPTAIQTQPNTGTASTKPITPEEAAKESEKMYQDSEEAVLRSGRKNYWALFKKLTGNRKTNIEKVITTTEKGVFANAAVENVSGSMSYADEQFMDARKRLYARTLMKIDKRFGKMSIKINKPISEIDAKTKQALEEIILHRRVIEIDSNTDKKNKKLDEEISKLEDKKKATTNTLAKAKVSEELKKLKTQRKDRIEHPRGFNKEMSEAAIEGIKNRVGVEVFNDIEKRANAYFEIRGEILDKAVEEGLVSKDTAYNLTGDDYIERRFLEYILEDHKSYGQSNSLSSAQIKALSEGSQGLVLMDSEVLLHAAYRSIENRVAQNKANRALAEAVSEQKFDKSVVIPAEFQKNLNGKYKTDKYGNRVLKTAPTGFELIPFYDNGEKSGVFMRINEASEWNDSVKLQVMIGDINLDSIAKTVLGVKILKFFATLANPLFAYGNMFRDFAKVLFLSSTYDNNILTAAPRLLANFSGKVAQYTALKTSGIASDDFRQLIDDYTKYGGKFEFLHRDGKSSNLYKNTLNKKKYLISKIGGGVYNLFENAMGLPGEISEISMRLAVFEKTRDTLIDKHGGRSNIDAAQMADINLVAANASRAIMDYNKGGLATKWLDNFSPYLNASVVGFVSDVNYIKKNPKKFAAKMAILGTNVAAITLYNLMNSDEEDRKNIPQYIKDNNFIFFIPGKNKDGKKNYVTIPKYQGLQPFTAMFEESTEIVYNMYMGKPQKNVGEVANRLQETVSTWSPIPMTSRGAMLKLPPVVQATYAYNSNYDLYRDSKIEYRQGKIPTKDEGLDNDKTARVFRVLGQMSSKLGDNYTISPSRAQNFTEKLITSPTTNFIVGNIYGIADWVTQEYQIPREIKEAKSATIKSSVKNKFVREVDPEYLAKFKSKANTIEKEITADSEYEQKTIKLMVANNEPKENIVKFIKELDASPEVKETRLKKAAELIETKDYPKTVPYYGELMDVKYIDGLTFPTPEDKAVKAFDRFGGVDPKSEDFFQIIDSAKKLKVITKGDSETRFLKEYSRLFQKGQPEGKQK